MKNIPNRPPRSGKEEERIYFEMQKWDIHTTTIGNPHATKHREIVEIEQANDTDESEDGGIRLNQHHYFTLENKIREYYSTNKARYQAEAPQPKLEFHNLK